MTTTTERLDRAAGTRGGERSVKAPRLVRTRGGLMIHRVNCRYTNAHNATPWYWADGRDIDLLLIVAENHGLRICRVCRPLEESP